MGEPRRGFAHAVGTWRAFEYNVTDALARPILSPDDTERWRVSAFLATRSGHAPARDAMSDL